MEKTYTYIFLRKRNNERANHHGSTCQSRGKEILSGVNLTILSGEVHALMGPNGSGKSTLAHILMGRPGYEITQGNITLNGEDITNKPMATSWLAP